MVTKWLTVIEAAEYLRMGKSTVYRLLSQGKIPAHKVGQQWRFDATQLDEWLRSGKLSSSSKGRKYRRKR